MNEQGEDDLIQMELRRFVAVVFVLLLLIAGAAFGTIAVIGYMFFWSIG
jgi:hypothetical protein